jgi:hypothetical protein
MELLHILSSDSYQGFIEIICGVDIKEVGMVNVPPVNGVKG